MRILFILLCVLSLDSVRISAQAVSVNTTGAPPNPSALLDVQSSTQGMLVPRMDSAARELITSPATGLIVYDLTSQCLYYYNGSGWIEYNEPAFVKDGEMIRQKDNYADDFILGRETLPVNGEMITDSFLLFDKSKGAFRGGLLLNSASWSPDSVGRYSFGFGKNVKASGDYATATGSNSEASGIYAIAMGADAEATGSFSVALGKGGLAGGDYSAAIGYNAEATGLFSTAIGYTTDAPGINSVAIGYSAEASGPRSIALGVNAEATGSNSLASGSHIVAPSAYETVFGRYNTLYTPSSTGLWNSGDRLLVIGNGTLASNRSDAMIVMKSGDTYFPEGSLMVGRDTFPVNGELITDNFAFFNKSNGAFRGGILASSVNWAPDMTGSYSFAYGYNVKADASYSTAFGYLSSATGIGSMATGNQTEANGNYSFATGYQTQANGTYAFSSGLSSQSSGIFTTAMGAYTTAESGYEMVIGRYNTDYVPISTYSWSSNDRLFVIGNGTGSGSSRSDAMVVMKSGDTFIPDGSLVVGRDGLPATGQLITDNFAFFNKSNGAFRGGRLSYSENWAPDMTGSYSFAYGYNVKAEASYSTAFGYLSVATGNGSTAVGYQAEANGYASFATGYQTQANGGYAFSSGFSSLSSGSYTTVMGAYTTAESGFETVIGRYNTDYVPLSTTYWNANDRLFVIGNGTGSTARSDAMIVLKNGDTQINGDAIVTHSNSASTGGIHVINTAAPAELWRIYTSSGSGNLRFYSDDNGGTTTAYINDVTGVYTEISDRRRKKNIEPIRPVLQDVLDLEVKSYHFKTQGDDAEKSLGLIAQEVDILFPELVAMEDELYSLNYNGFGVLAVKAIQEQQQIIDDQQAQIQALHQMITQNQAAIAELKAQYTSLLPQPVHHKILATD